MSNSTPDDLVKEAGDIIEQAVDYMARTQPLLDKHAEASEKFATALPETADKLVERGLLAEDKKDVFVEKSAEDHSYLLKYLDKLAESVSADQIGTPTQPTNDAKTVDDHFAWASTPDPID
jgi:hypothetical protein